MTDELTDEQREQIALGIGDGSNDAMLDAMDDPDDPGTELGDDDEGAQALREWLQRDTDALAPHQLEHGAKVSDSTSGCWAVYDNQELRFVAGGGIHFDRDDAQRELDELRATTGHDLVVVEV